MGASEAVLILVAPAVGSFLGTLILRLPAGEPVIAGRSRCPACGGRLAWCDLVPLVSWFRLRGRCRRCGARIGWLYPAIEATALVVAVWSVLLLPGPLAWPSAVLGWTLLALAEIDRRHMVIPDRLMLPLIPAGWAVAWWQGPHLLPEAVIGAAAGFLGLLAVARLYRRLRGRDGLGRGDAKLLAAAGAWTGWAGLPGVLVIGGLATLALAAARRLGGGDRVPLGPGLASGLWLVWSFGPLP